MRYIFCLGPILFASFNIKVEYKMNILLLRIGGLKAIPQRSIFQTVFHEILTVLFPEEFHDPINSEKTELSKVK